MKNTLKLAFREFTPDIIYFNAGTDILIDDPIGDLGFSKEDIITRDEMVFSACFSRKVPIVMVLSGGYSKENYKVIAESIENLLKVFSLN